MNQLKGVAVHGRRVEPVVPSSPPSPMSSFRESEWSEIVEITPAIAEQWLRDYSYEGQRPLSTGRVERLVFEMKRGTFRTSEIRLVHVGGKIQNTNGNHRLHAVVESGVTIRANVYHVIEEDNSGASDDYAYCDIHGIRNPNDQFAATDLLERSGLTRAQFNSLVAALGPIIGGFMPISYTTMSPELRSFDVRKKSIQEWFSVADQYYQSFFNCDSAIGIALKRKSVMSVALITFACQPEKAFAFWNGMAENDGLKKGDPRRTLHSFLLANAAKSIYPHAYSRYVAAAWNSWFKGETNLQLKVYDGSKPIRIMGSSYDGKMHYRAEID